MSQLKTKKVGTLNNNSENTKQEVCNKSKFAAPFSKVTTREQAQKVLDTLIEGFTAAFNEKVVTFAPSAPTKTDKPVKDTKAATAKEEATTPIKEGDKKAIKKLALQFHEYNDKSFAITGDTKAIKDIMKKYKGRFNSYLSVGAGWIFSKRYEADVRKALCI